MNTKNIPALVMLTAGLTASIVMYRMQYELHTMLWILLLVFFGFYIFGWLIKIMLDKFGIQKEEQQEQQEEQAEQNEENNEKQDGSVIEKQ